MALEFARTSIIGRGAGHSVVKASAYRSGERLKDERIGRNVDYSHRVSEIMASEILLPAGADKAFLDRQTLWTAVEDREDLSNNRANAQLAKDHVIALPRELSLDQQIELAKGFAREQFVSKGLVVDMNIHYHSDGNPHAHLLTTTRNLEGSQFGLKNREANGAFIAGKKVPPAEQLRHSWADFQNKYFLERGIDALVTNNNGEFEAEIHVGKAKWVDDRGELATNVELNKSKIEGRAAVLLEKPEIVINRVADRKSVFTKHDLWRELHKLVDDQAVFTEVKAKLDNHHSLRSIDPSENRLFTTADIQDLEFNISGIGEMLNRESDDIKISDKTIDSAIANQEFLSDEQADAVRYICGKKRLASVVGLAGAGKSTLLKAFNEAVLNSGLKVSGIALAGKAAEELTNSSGIESRTIASWLIGVKNGTIRISNGETIVMDEAGMVNNKSMSAVMDIVSRSGAKLVLVGDGEQLQPIQAGSPFRSLSERFGSADVETIRRQKVDWQREATFNIAKGQGSDAFNEYDRKGFVNALPKDEILEKLVSDYAGDFNQCSQAILAHRNADVKLINELVREKLKLDADLKDGQLFKAGSSSSTGGVPIGTQPGDSLIFTESIPIHGIKSGERATYIHGDSGRHTLQLSGGEQLSFEHSESPNLVTEVEEKATDIELSVGDRILFTKNDSGLNVKNGMLGTLNSYEKGVVSIAMDDGGEVSFTADEYSNIAHGYATTIHKSQGMTVDKSYLYASSSMDKHLGYVGLSRHRESVQIYLDTDQLSKNKFASQLEKANRQQNVNEYTDLEGVQIDQIIDVSKEIDMNDVATSPSYQDALTVTESEQTLANARQLIESQLIQKAQLAINNAETISRNAERSLANHKSNEPKQGLFSDKNKHREWATKLDSLEKESCVSKKEMSSLKSTFASSQESMRREARLQAERKHPVEAKMAKTARVTEKTNSLIDSLNSLEAQRNELSAENDMQKKSQIIDKIDRTVRQLQGPGVELDKKQTDRVKNAADTVSKQKREMAKERSRGGHEM